MSRIVPTYGQLQAAFQGVRRADWPQDLEGALAHPLYGRLVRLHAGLLAEGRDPFLSQRTNHRPVVEAPEPPHPADAQVPFAPRACAPRRRPHTPAPSPQLPLIDRKRAAAGDADDD